MKNLDKIAVLIQKELKWFPFLDDNDFEEFYQILKLDDDNEIEVYNSYSNIGKYKSSTVNMYNDNIKDYFLVVLSLI